MNILSLKNLEFRLTTLFLLMKRDFMLQIKL